MHSALVPISIREIVWELWEVKFYLEMLTIDRKLVPVFPKEDDDLGMREVEDSLENIEFCMCMSFSIDFYPPF